jgi:serine/threonine protein kinase/tetratricopeptide (TPR) repeat protein
VNEAFSLIGKRYQPETLLGQGGMGEVYRAVDRLTGQHVALKRVKSLTEHKDANSHQDSLNFRLALAREFKVLASLRHPNIISVLDYGFDDERQPYVTMELLDEARDFLAAAEDESLNRRIDLLIQLLQALAYLHRRGILHRDLKPSNVLVALDDELKVLDFGLAMEPEKAEGLVGTLDYMAPEILQGQQATPAADLYAVGVMAYQLFTGRHPFNTDNVQKLLWDVLNSMPDLSFISGGKTVQPTANDTEGAKTLAPGADLDFVTEDINENAEETLKLDKPLSPVDTHELRATFDAALNRDSDSDDSVVEGESALAAIVGKLLSKTPQSRYHNAVDLITDIANAVGIPVPEESAAIRESFLQAAAFVGREAELKQLEVALNWAMDGIGSGWLVAGESGVGKSRLLEELRILSLVRGITVLRGQGVTDGGLSYQLWREPLRRLILTTEMNDLDASILKDIVPDIADLLGRPIPDTLPLEGTAHQERLLGAITDLFQRQTHPIMLLLEDLQWVSESLEVLKRLNGMVGNLPLLIIGNYRLEERPNLPEELPGMQVLRLERLSPGSIADLSASMLGEAGRDPTVLELLRRETEGNVFFLVEVVRALAEEVGGLDNIGRKSLPTQVLAGGIQTIIQRRLERVPENGRKLLRLAAVYGREIDLKILEQVKDGLDLEDWLTTCINCAVLEVQDGRYRFAHDKLREATLGAIPASVRPSLHRQIAEAIENISTNMQEQAGVLVQHWRAAGEPAKEFAMLQQAGDYALHISALPEAVSYFERAVQLQADVPKADDKRLTASLHVKLAEALHLTGDLNGAEKQIEEGLKLYRELKDEAGMARALNIRGDNYWRSGDRAAAVEACAESLALYRQLRDLRGIARILNRLGMLSFDQGDYARAHEQIKEGLAAADEAEDRETRTISMNNLAAVAMRQGDYEASARYFERNLAMLQESGQRRRIASVLHNMGTLAGIQGNLNDANRYFEQALSICRAIGERPGVALALDNLGYVAQVQGKYEQAIRYLEESLALAKAMGNRPRSASSLLNLGHVSVAIGDSARARDQYMQALQIAREIESTPFILEILCGLARLQDSAPLALGWLGMVLKHPAASQETQEMATQGVERFKESFTPEEIEALTAKGEALDLEAVVTTVLES